MVSQPQSGFSLIVLMITITIMTLLIVMVTSLTGYWVKQSEVDQAVMSMKSAIELSRTTAIRNVAAQQDSAASTAQCANSMFMSFQHGAVYETHHFNQ